MPIRRSQGLDALRGFAILTMVLSGVIPYGTLPHWMYHAQLPPPEHQFNPQLPGLTWVDLVFPLFLFALGAAIPMALKKRLERGQSILSILWHIAKRTILLAFFAIFLHHVRPHQMNPQPQAIDWMLALLGFALMFTLFTRLPDHWDIWIKRTIRLAGWTGSLLMLSLLNYGDGGGFSLYRSDIIIVVLTNTFFFASLIWLFTEKRWLTRVGLLGMLLALRLSSQESGWIQWLWNASPIPWLFKFDYLQYLFIVVPGTIVGDLLRHEQGNTDNKASAYDQKNKAYHWLIIGLVVLVIIQLVGLQSRWVWQTFMATIILSSMIWMLWRSIIPRNDHTLATILAWGIYLLITGLLLEPFEGGIKKDPSTLSYYFVTAGLSVFLLLIFTIIIDIKGHGKPLHLLILNGQNPMIAYVGFANLIWPVLALSGLESLIASITQHPWLGFLRGVIYTLILAWIVGLFSRKRLFWRT
ncbi:MAG: DUF5009 domain-containing protein [Caldithrix sp.]|nr:DUF5009 domain-containing protein [Caldithrix sp.]